MRAYTVNGRTHATVERDSPRTRPENRAWVCVPNSMTVSIEGNTLRFQTNSHIDAVRSACLFLEIQPESIQRDFL